MRTGRTARIWLLAKPAGVIIPRQDRRTVVDSGGGDPQSASGRKPDVRAGSLGNYDSTPAIPLAWSNSDNFLRA
jgi:hypothetical protein